jgi:hypothetical protein
MGKSGQLQASATLTHGTRWFGGWVGPRTRLDDVETRKFLTIPGLEFQPIGRPALSQLLYRLSYRGSSKYSYVKVKLSLYLIVHHAM